MPKIRRNFGHWEKKTGILPKGTHFGGLKGGDGEERKELNGLDIHGPGEADGEVLLSYIVMFHKTRFLDLCRMMKK